MEIPNVIEKAKLFFLKTFNKECEVIAVKLEGNKYVVTVETIVDSEYTRKRALPEVVALYVLYLDNDYNVIEYERKEQRKRYNL